MGFRKARATDLEQLLAIEAACFSIDRLSKRSFRHWISAEHGVLIVAEDARHKLLGYGLLWCHQGTRLARLYSLAVLPELQGQGVAQQLLVKLEAAARDKARVYLRLEVAKNNEAAIRLYERADYRVFGEYSDYYEDHSDAYRMQKKIVSVDASRIERLTPWYQQTTEFSCGPAALMMAMASLDEHCQPEQMQELDIWREATTIFMTSGHGGCHPIGLALAAQRRGYQAQVLLNTEQPLFIDGVRSAYKKNIMQRVHEHFAAQAVAAGVRLRYQDFSLAQIDELLASDHAVMMLISTYRLDGKKAPHWVTLSNIDDRYLYVHDPDLDADTQLPIDCQYVPICRDDFEKMSTFGSSKLRTAVAIKKV